MYPVEELFLEDILERVNYVVDEYSRNCRKVNKTMSRQIDDMECSLELADTFTRDTLAPSRAPDETLSVKQLFYRYKGTHKNFESVIFFGMIAFFLIVILDYSRKTRKTILLLDPKNIDPELIVCVIAWIVDGDHDYPREGSILVFLPGIADIMAVHDELKGHNFLSPRTGNFMIIPLHSSISNEEQGAVFK